MVSFVLALIAIGAGWTFHIFSNKELLKKDRKNSPTFAKGMWSTVVACAVVIAIPVTKMGVDIMILIALGLGLAYAFYRTLQMSVEVVSSGTPDQVNSENNQGDVK